MRRRNRCCTTANGEARIALFSPRRLARALPAAGHATTDECDGWNARFEHFEARQRQFAAVLGAHGVPVTFVHCDAAGSRTGVEDALDAMLRALAMPTRSTPRRIRTELFVDR